jgi:hypothetical protein
MVDDQSNLRECRPRDFRTKDPNEIARFGEERLSVVARSLVVVVVFNILVNSFFSVLLPRPFCSIIYKAGLVRRDRTPMSLGRGGASPVNKTT